MVSILLIPFFRPISIPLFVKISREKVEVRINYLYEVIKKLMRYYLDAVERAVRNIARGENAQNLVIGTFQARIVKTLQEEGVIPLMLIEKGYARPLEDIGMLEELLEEKKDVNNGND